MSLQQLLQMMGAPQSGMDIPGAIRQQGQNQQDSLGQLLQSFGHQGKPMLRRDIRGGTSGSPTPGLDAWHQMNPDARVGEFDPLGTKVARRRGLRGATADAQGQNELVGELVWGDFLDRLRGNIRGQGGNQNPSGSPTGNPSPTGAGTNFPPDFMKTLMQGYEALKTPQNQDMTGWTPGPAAGGQGQGGQPQGGQPRPGGRPSPGQSQPQPNPVAQASGFGNATVPQSAPQNPFPVYQSTQGQPQGQTQSQPQSRPGSQPPQNFDPGFDTGFNPSPQDISSWFNPSGGAPQFASQGFGMNPIDSQIPGQQFPTGFENYNPPQQSPMSGSLGMNDMDFDNYINQAFDTPLPNNGTPYPTMGSNLAQYSDLLTQLFQMPGTHTATQPPAPVTSFNTPEERSQQIKREVFQDRENYAQAQLNWEREHARKSQEYQQRINQANDNIQIPDWQRDTGLGWLNHLAQRAKNQIFVR